MVGNLDFLQTKIKRKSEHETKWKCVTIFVLAILKMSNIQIAEKSKTVGLIWDWKWNSFGKIMKNLI